MTVAALPGEAVIGLEVHVQLRTDTKLFCADEAAFGAPPNSHVCPVCLGLPGALPVLNRAAVELAVRAAAGLGCAVNTVSTFGRKHYFYPDLPKGYQITQYDRPLATGGTVTVDDADGAAFAVRLRRLHIEEDAGRSVHDRLREATGLDFNRAGVPLIEIVTEPDLRSARQARAFLEQLRRTLRYLDVSDCDMEKGSLRVDVNVSVHAAEAAVAKTELKNLNSFSGVERAIDFELDRQRRVLAGGEHVQPQTLLWDAARGQARPMRDKEENPDYRYFTEPDLPPLHVDAATVERIRQALPEMPVQRQARIAAEYGLPVRDARVLAADRELADYFEAVSRRLGDAGAARNWVLRDVLAWLNAHGAEIAAFPVPPDRLADLVRLVIDGRVSPAAARDVLASMAETGAPAESVIDERGLRLVDDDARIGDRVDAVVAAFPVEVERFRAGEARVFDFLMGQVMARGAGTADPRRVAELLRIRLDA